MFNQKFSINVLKQKYYIEDCNLDLKIWNITVQLKFDWTIGVENISFLFELELHRIILYVQVMFCAAVLESACVI